MIFGIYIINAKSEIRLYSDIVSTSKFVDKIQKCDIILWNDLR
jgi:hypothetical protein